MATRAKRAVGQTPEPTEVTEVTEAVEAVEAATPEAEATAAAAAAPLETELPHPATAPNGEDAFAALVESQAAVARGLAEIGAEMAGLAHSGIDAAARTAGDMLAVKTLADAIELSAGFAYASFERFVAGSTKLSEISLRVATEASQPLVARFGRDWAKAAR